MLHCYKPSCITSLISLAALIHHENAGLSVQSHEMHKAVYLATTHDLVNGEDWGVLGTLPWAPFSPAPWGHCHWWWREGGREVSQRYQQDSTQHSNRWVPETAGGKGRADGWATSKERKKKEEGEKEKKAMFIPLRLHQMTAALQFSA